MPPVNIMIKPASGLCNLNCRYCFYQDIASNRETASYGIMSTATLEQVVKQIFLYAEKECTIAWQGGEPTLAGLDFFKTYIELERKYNVNQITVHRALQTNGYGLDESWAEFFAEHRFLVGLSLDGVRSCHNAMRKTAGGEDTFASVLETARLFKKHRVDYNILTVVNKITADKLHFIYPFFKKQGFRYQQYIACLDPLGEEPGQYPWSLTPEIYGRFLIELFDLWYADCLQGRAPYIRQFENYLGILMGIQPESCEQRGVCALNTVVEADGSVYPCDFFVTDDYRLGNLYESTLKELRKHPKADAFFRRSADPQPDCKSCPYLHLCRGGCYRHRLLPDGSGGQNYFCQSYRMFFDKCLPRLQTLAQQIR